MTDLDRSFRSLDTLEPPDVSADIVRRAASPAPAPAGIPPRSRVAAALVAFFVFAVAVGLGVGALRDRPTDEPSPEPVPDVWAGLREGFTQLPDPPISGQGMVTLWGDGQLFIWGGQLDDEQPHRDEGYLFDVATRTWRRVADPPLSPRSYVASVWTGSEFVVWGGWTGQDWPPERLIDGAAYDPGSDTWRTIATAPVKSDTFPQAVWTGTEMIVMWADWRANESPGAAYDPSSDRWRALSEPTVQLQGADLAWTERQVVALGTPSVQGIYPDVTATAVAYDPTTDAWQTLPDTGLVPNSTEIVWDGSRLVAMDYNNRVVAFEEAAAIWRELPHVAANQCEGGLTSPAVRNGTLVMSACSDLVALESGAERWRILVGEGEPAPPIEYQPVIAAGDAFLIYAWEGRSDETLWAYRPPAPTEVRRAWDVAAAYGATRSNYPYEADQVPEEALEQMETLISSAAAAKYDDRELYGLSPLWTYYWGFRVLRVDEGEGGTFTAFLRLERGGATLERLTIGPGVAIDGVERDLVILDVEPVDGIAEMP